MCAVDVWGALHAVDEAAANVFLSRNDGPWTAATAQPWFEYEPRTSMLSLVNEAEIL